MILPSTTPIINDVDNKPIRFARISSDARVQPIVRRPHHVEDVIPFLYDSDQHVAQGDLQ